MKTIIKLEELGLFILGIYFFNQMNYAWWWFLCLILVPDFAMIGYFFGDKIGAFCYNFFHHRAIAILVYFIGIYFHQNEIILAGIILFSHAAFDRMLGYGLKYETGFKYTHLGKIGK